MHHQQSKSLMSFRGLEVLTAAFQIMFANLMFTKKMSIQIWFDGRQHVNVYDRETALLYFEERFAVPKILINDKYN